MALIALMENLITALDDGNCAEDRLMHLQYFSQLEFYFGQPWPKLGYSII